MSQSELARRVGVKQPSVSEWVRMRARPESHYRKVIWHLFGIPEDDWLTDMERTAVDAAASAGTRSIQRQHPANEPSTGTDG